MTESEQRHEAIQQVLDSAGAFISEVTRLAPLTQRPQLSVEETEEGARLSMTLDFGIKEG